MDENQQKAEEILNQLNLQVNNADSLLESLNSINFDPNLIAKLHETIGYAEGVLKNYEILLVSLGILIAVALAVIAYLKFNFDSKIKKIVNNVNEVLEETRQQRLELKKSVLNHSLKFSIFLYEDASPVVKLKIASHIMTSLNEAEIKLSIYLSVVPKIMHFITSLNKSNLTPEDTIIIIAIFKDLNEICLDPNSIEVETDISMLMAARNNLGNYLGLL